jgi:signal transduction histidine kinase
MSGVELLQRILRTTPNCFVFLMTGGPTVDTAVQAMRAGAFDYLLKPIALSTFLDSVKRVVEVRAQGDEARRSQKEDLRYQKTLELLVEKRTAELRERERTYEEICNRERERLRRELHDGVCQHLTGIGFLSVRLREGLQDAFPDLAALADDIYRISRESVDMAQQIAVGLAPFENRPATLATALEAMASDVASIYGIRCVATCDNGMALADDVAHQLYLIAREATTNAAKHSGAGRIEVRLFTDSRHTTVQVSDDGRGMPALTASSDVPAKRAGMGLDIMRDRAKMIGAHFDISTPPTGGTCVTCRWQVQSATGAGGTEPQDE